MGAAGAAEGRAALGTQRPDWTQRCENTTAPHRSTSSKLGSPQTGRSPRRSGSSAHGNNWGGTWREIRYTRTGTDRPRANSPFRRRESRGAVAAAVTLASEDNSSTDRQFPSRERLILLARLEEAHLASASGALRRLRRVTRPARAGPICIHSLARAVLGTLTLAPASDAASPVLIAVFSYKRAEVHSRAGRPYPQFIVRATGCGVLRGSRLSAQQCGPEGRDHTQAPGSRQSHHH